MTIKKIQLKKDGTPRKPTGGVRPGSGRPRKDYSEYVGNTSGSLECKAIIRQQDSEGVYIAVALCECKLCGAECTPRLQDFLRKHSTKQVWDAVNATPDWVLTKVATYIIQTGHFYARDINFDELAKIFKLATNLYGPKKINAVMRIYFKARKKAREIKGIVFLNVKKVAIAGAPAFSLALGISSNTAPYIEDQVSPEANKLSWLERCLQSNSITIGPASSEEYMRPKIQRRSTSNADQDDIDYKRIATLYNMLGETMFCKVIASITKQDLELARLSKPPNLEHFSHRCTPYPEQRNHASALSEVICGSRSVMA